MGIRVSVYPTPGPTPLGRPASLQTLSRGSRDGGGEEGGRALDGAAAEGVGEAVEAVDAAGIDRELGVVAGSEPTRVHEERVVEQGAERADGEARPRQGGEVGVDRRDVGVEAPFRPDEVVEEPVHDGRAEDEVALTPVAQAGRAPQVVDAVGGG